MEQLVKSQKKLSVTILKQMVTLATSGFGLVAALAWNNVIQELVNDHIKPFLPQGSSLLSLFAYAVLITVLAVTITYNLVRLTEKIEQMPAEKKEVVKARKKKKLRRS